jgi:hypothetical protein
LSKVGPSTQEGVVQATNPPLDVVVADDRLVSHAGVALLAELADRLGLSSSLDRFVGGRGRARRHPLARVLRDLIVMLADVATASATCGCWAAAVRCWGRWPRSRRPGGCWSASGSWVRTGWPGCGRPAPRCERERGLPVPARHDG